MNDVLNNKLRSGSVNRRMKNLLAALAAAGAVGAVAAAAIAIGWRGVK